MKNQQSDQSMLPRKREQMMAHMADTHSSGNPDAVTMRNIHRPRNSAVLKKRKFSEALNLDEDSSNAVSEEAKGEGSGSPPNTVGTHKLFICQHPGCSKTFTRKVRLQAHMHIHNGTQPFKCPFPGCGKAFSEKQNLKIHARIHEDRRPYPCP